MEENKTKRVWVEHYKKYLDELTVEEWQEYTNVCGGIKDKSC